MYENSIIHKAALVPLHESDFVAKFESNWTIFRGCYNVRDFVVTFENKRQSFFHVLNFQWSWHELKKSTVMLLLNQIPHKNTEEW